MKLTIVVVVLLALFVPGVLAAQGELTLEGLAEQVAGLAEKIAIVEAKLEPVTTADGVCIQYSYGQLQRETITKYFDSFDENIGSATLEAVHYDVERGLTTYHFRDGYPVRRVTETWRGCHFLDMGEWTEDE